VVLDTKKSRPDNRRYVLLKRASTLTRQEMLDHWLTTHANLIINIPEFWRYTSRYLQNHVLDEVEVPTGNIQCDGIVETWQRPRTNPYSLFADEEAYRTRVRADERTFLSMAESVAILTEVNVIIDGPESGLKLISMIRRSPQLSHEQFAFRFLTEYANRIRQLQEVQPGLIRYIQCICLPQMERDFSGDKPSVGIDAVSELRFASREAMQAVLFSKAQHSLIRSEDGGLVLDQSHFLVREIEISRPLAAPGEQQMEAR